MTPQQVVDAAEAVAADHRQASSWNYDVIETRVHDAIAEAFEEFARRISEGVEVCVCGHRKENHAGLYCDGCSLCEGFVRRTSR